MKDFRNLSVRVLIWRKFVLLLRLYSVISRTCCGNSPDRYSGTMLFTILKNIVNLWQFRLVDKRSQPSSSRRDLWLVCLYARVHVSAAWRCTFSICLHLASVHESKITSPYSSLGRIKTLYILLFCSRGICLYKRFKRGHTSGQYVYPKSCNLSIVGPNACGIFILNLPW